MLAIGTCTTESQNLPAVYSPIWMGIFFFSLESMRDHCIPVAMVTEHHSNILPYYMYTVSLFLLSELLTHNIWLQLMSSDFFSCSNI